MNNEPVAWINIERWKDTSSYLEDCVADMKLESAGITTPLYTHPHPDNLGLAESIIKQQQLEIEALKEENIGIKAVLDEYRTQIQAEYERT